MGVMIWCQMGAGGRSPHSHSKEGWTGRCNCVYVGVCMCMFVCAHGVSHGMNFACVKVDFHLKILR